MTIQARVTRIASAVPSVPSGDRGSQADPGTALLALTINLSCSAAVVGEGQRWGRAAPARRSSVLATARALGTIVTDDEAGVESLVLKKGAPVPTMGFSSAAWDGYEDADASLEGDVEKAKMGIVQVYDFVKGSSKTRATHVRAEWLWQPKEIPGMLEKYGPRTVKGELLRNLPREFVTLPIECLGERVYVYDGQEPYEEEDGDASGLAYFLNGYWWKCKKYGARARSRSCVCREMLTFSCALVAARDIPCTTAQRKF